MASGNHAANQIGMPGEVFRSRMHDEVDAELRWMLVDGRAECGVDHAEQIVLLCNHCHFLEVNNAQSWIRWRLQIEQLCVRTNGSRVLIVFRGVDKCGLNSQLRQPLREKLVRAAVNIALRHNVVATLEKRHDRCGDRAHARGEGERRFHAFQLRNSLFRNRVRRIAVARVKVVGMGGAQLLVVVGDFKRGSLIDGRRHRTVLLFQIRRAAHRLGFGMVFLPFHERLVPTD